MTETSTPTSSEAANTAPVVESVAATEAVITPEIKVEAKTEPSTDWRADLPETLRERAESAKWSSATDAVKALTLKADASEEEVAAWADALGRPKDPSGYKLEFKDQSIANSPLGQHAAEICYRSGIAPAQAKLLVDNLTALNQAQLDAWNKQCDNETESLKSTWGAKYEENKMLALKGYEVAGLAPEVAKNVESIIGPKKFIELALALGGGTFERFAGATESAAAVEETLTYDQAVKARTEILRQYGGDYAKAISNPETAEKLRHYNKFL